MPYDRTLGATFLPDGRCRFRVWAPKARRVDVHLFAPRERVERLEADECGYFEVALEGVAPGSLYRYRLDSGSEWPDPASRYQPDGVHGPSAVVDPRAFPWTDQAWRGVPQERLVIYELHVGTFTEAGTFDGAIEHLAYLRDLGVTAIELMPVAQFPGRRNWGYDGVYPFAVQDSYGGPEGLRRFVDAAHAHGLAVLLDCVYNHFGPEGNYTGQYGYYLTDVYHSPWGDAINMDGPHSDEVRRYFIESALHWVDEYHVDGFRLDATDRIIDTSSGHFLQELAEQVHALGEQLGRYVWVIAESDANDVRYLLPPVIHGFGLDAQWGDDFHHALHALLTGERQGYYADFGALHHLAKAYRQNFVYDGVYSRDRRRRHGNSPALAAAKQFVVCTQNHDQVGNRATGDRLAALVPSEALKLAAGVMLLSPYVPLLFMGEEYAETAPFQYFTDHGDPGLRRAVSEGRRAEFAGCGWQGEVPDPQDPETFARSRLNHHLRDEGRHRAMLAWYRELLRLRRELPALARLSKDHQEVVSLDRERALVVRRWDGTSQVVAVFSFSDGPRALDVPAPAGGWRVVLDSADRRWGGRGIDRPGRLDSDGVLNLALQPWACVVLERLPDDGHDMRR